MVQNYILDTCIWRDYYADRLSNDNKPFGEYATKLFIKILKSKEIILFSDILIFELGKDYDESEIQLMLDLLFYSGTLVKIEITKEEHLEAKDIATRRNLPLIDCLYAIQARNHNAILVSQDSHLRIDLADITKTKRPQDII